MHREAQTEVGKGQQLIYGVEVEESIAELLGQDKATNSATDDWKSITGRG
jgi:hypothetical protein